jgi:hypothetical protein
MVLLTLRERFGLTRSVRSTAGIDSPIGSDEQECPSYKEDGHAA